MSELQCSRSEPSGASTIAYGASKFVDFRTSEWVMSVRQACLITRHDEGCKINAKE